MLNAIVSKVDFFVFIHSPKEFGALVRSEREKQQWSQSQLAELAGVSLPWLSQFERGKPTARIGLVMKTLKTLDIKLWAGDLPKTTGLKATVVDLDELVANQPESMLITEDGRIVIDPEIPEE